MSKSAKKRSTSSGSTRVAAAKSAVSLDSVETRKRTVTPSKFPTEKKRQREVDRDGKVAAGSKQSCLIAMLQSPEGATVATMMQATGWQRHSVRGFLAGVVRKRLNLNLRSKTVKGNRVYRLAGGDSRRSTARQAKHQPA